MAANNRIQWLHKKITEYSYPNAMRLAERFNVSHRQAQRDVDFLRKQLGAPIASDAEHKGFYYTTDFSLPVLLTSDNDESYMGVVSSIYNNEDFAADSSVIQMQMPYTAVVEIPDKLSVLELRSFIISKESRNRYVCEFHNVERFLSVIMALDSPIRIMSPYWLRERLIGMAERVLKANKSIDSEE